MQHLVDNRPYLYTAAGLLAFALAAAVALSGCGRDEKPGPGAEPAPEAKPAETAQPAKKADAAKSAAPANAAKPAEPPNDAKKAELTSDAASPSPDPDRVRALVKAYEKARLGLALDDIQATRAGAEALRVAAAGFAATLDGGARNRLTALARAAKALATTADFKAARLAFGKVSTQIIVLAHGAKLGGEVFVFQCPMVEEGEARWLQATAEMNNPYMGKRMPKCGGRVPLRPTP